MGVYNIKVFFLSQSIIYLMIDCDKMKEGEEC